MADKGTVKPVATEVKTTAAQPKRPLRSLREKILRKSERTGQSSPSASPATEMPDTAATASHTIASSASPGKQSASPNPGARRDREGTPTSQLHTDEGSPFSDSPGSERCRQSIIRYSGRGWGVEMDLATKEANQRLLEGKEAIEAACNMKKDCKQTALESLQSLYEIVLALSDSRSRHKLNLEKERLRHS
ncbi:uncharacterized protein LOC123722942 [Papilio machaon]|uniref:uncharacterized protein LOC123722942 n=1 Tax=Papilio machaon TaxID=76193 RepID=UPI001E66521C|nr:uncharacterized protein LOC123722942 [Papilio machaon]